MGKLSNLPKTLPTKDIPFEYEGVGQLSGHKYPKSTFVVRVPSTRDLTRIGVETAKLSGGVPTDMLDGVTGSLNRAIAFLTVTLAEAPAWFINHPENTVEEGMSYGLDAYDLNIPIEIYQKADELIEGWHAKVRGAHDKKAKKD